MRLNKIKQQENEQQRKSLEEDLGVGFDMSMVSSEDTDRFNHIGYCHGLTLLWLSALFQNKKDFFHVINFMLTAKIKEFLKPENISLVLDFIYQLEWAQYSYIYTVTKTSPIHIDQRKIIDAFLGLKTTEKEAMSLGEIYLLLQKYPSNLFMVIGSEKHTVGVFCFNNQLQLFDVDYDICQVRTYSSKDSLSFLKDLASCLFKGSAAMDIRFIVNYANIPQPAVLQSATARTPSEEQKTEAIEDSRSFRL